MDKLDELLRDGKYEEADILAKEEINKNPDDYKAYYVRYLASNNDYLDYDRNNINNEVLLAKALELAGDNRELLESEKKVYDNIEPFQRFDKILRLIHYEEYEEAANILNEVKELELLNKPCNKKLLIEGLDYLLKTMPVESVDAYCLVIGVMLYKDSEFNDLFKKYFKEHIVYLSGVVAYNDKKYDEALKNFESISSSYLNTADYIKECKSELNKIKKAQEEAERKRLEEEEQARQRRLEEERRIAEEGKRQKRIKEIKRETAIEIIKKALYITLAIIFFPFVLLYFLIGLVGKIIEDDNEEKLQVVVFLLPVVLTIVSGIVLFTNTDQINIISSSFWWIMAWAGLIGFSSLSLYYGLDSVIEDWGFGGEDNRIKAILAFVATAGLTIGFIIVSCRLKPNFNPPASMSITAIYKEETYQYSKDYSRIGFEVCNTDLDANVSYIEGEMVFYNNDKQISIWTVYFNGKYVKNFSTTTYIEISSDEDYNLYNSDFDALKITYKIKKMKFNYDSKIFNYNVEPVIIKDYS